MAEAVVGWNTAVSLRTETTYATDPGTGSVAFEFITESVVREFETLVQVDTRGAVERDNASQARENVTGSFDVYVNSENIGYLLFYILGTVATPAQQAATTAYLHLFTPNVLSTKSFTYEADYGEVAAKAKIALGCKMNSLSFDIADGYVTATVGLAGQTLDEDASPTAITFTTWPRTFDFKDFTFEIGATDESVDVVGGTITFSRANVEDDYRQGNQRRQSIPTGALSAEITLDLVYDPAMTTASQEVLDGTTTSTPVTITWTGDEIATPYNHKLEFEFPNCYVEASTPTTAAGGKVQRSVRIKPLHSYATSSELVRVSLINEKTSIYA